MGDSSCECPTKSYVVDELKGAEQAALGPAYQDVSALRRKPPRKIRGERR